MRQIFVLRKIIFQLIKLIVFSSRQLEQKTFTFIYLFTYFKIKISFTFLSPASFVYSSSILVWNLQFIYGDIISVQHLVVCQCVDAKCYLIILHIQCLFMQQSSQAVGVSGGRPIKTKQTFKALNINQSKRVIATLCSSQQNVKKHFYKTELFGVKTFTVEALLGFLLECNFDLAWKQVNK